MKPRYEFTYINTWMCVLLCLLEIYTVKRQNLSSHVMKLDTNEWNPHGNLSKATHKQSYIYKCVSVREREREREREKWGWWGLPSAVTVGGGVTGAAVIAAHDVGMMILPVRLSGKGDLEEEGEEEESRRRETERVALDDRVTLLCILWLEPPIMTCHVWVGLTPTVTT